MLKIVTQDIRYPSDPTQEEANRVELILSNA